MATNATSTIYSTGFADPNFLDSNQHSAKTDAYGLGISLLMALTGGEPCRGLRSAYEDDVLDMVAGKEGDGGVGTGGEFRRDHEAVPLRPDELSE